MKILPPTRGDWLRIVGNCVAVFVFVWIAVAVLTSGTRPAVTVEEPARGPELCSPARPCGNDGDAVQDRGVSVIHVQVDGRTVTCITVTAVGAPAAGLSCDWAGAR